MNAFPSTRRQLLAGSFSLLAAAQTPAKKLNVVCVGGHPADPESGCGERLARYSKAGHHVTIIYLTRGECGIAG